MLERASKQLALFPRQPNPASVALSRSSRPSHPLLRLMKVTSCLALAHATFRMSSFDEPMTVANRGFWHCLKGLHRKHEHGRILWENKKISFAV